MKSSIGQRLEAYALGQLGQIDRQLARPGVERHDGVHQARKCLRRTRAALALAANALGPDLKPIDDELRRLYRGLCTLRDAQAIVEAIERFRIGAVSPVRKLLHGARKSAAQHRDLVMSRTLARDPDFHLRRRRVLALRKRLAKLDWRAVRKRNLAAPIRRSERRLQKAHHRTSRHPDRNACWHAYRRRLRRLREQDAVLSALEPGRAHPDRHLGRQVRALGDSQDDLLVLKFCRRKWPFNAEQRALLRPMARSRLKSVRGKGP